MGPLAHGHEMDRAVFNGDKHPVGRIEKSTFDLKSLAWNLVHSHEVVMQPFFFLYPGTLLLPFLFDSSVAGVAPPRSGTGSIGATKK